MDVISNSHFEVIKQYIQTTGNVLKLRYHHNTWILEFISAHDYKHFTAITLGGVLKAASEWVSSNAVQKRETKASTLGETSRNSTPLAKEVRQEPRSCKGKI